MACHLNQIPLAFLPRFADTGALLSMSFGSSGLSVLLILDVVLSKRKKTHWIHADSFVLGSLTLEFVGLLYRPVVSISNAEKLNPEDVNHLFEMIYSNQLLILAQRVVMCVFIGILLPVAAGKTRDFLWSNISALALQALSLIIHISYDIYIVAIKGCIDQTHHLQRDYWTVWLVTSNLVVLFSIGLLVLLLVCAALASMSIQEVVLQRISMLFSEAKYWKRKGVLSVELSEENLSMLFEEQVVRAWIAARTCHTEYIIARSVLISSTGFIVTLCVPFAILGFIKNGYVFVYDGFDWLRLTALCLDLLFILLGWGIICWRWISAVVYYPRLGQDLREYFRVEDFWKRALLELQKEFKEWDVESIKKLSFLNRCLFIFFHEVHLYKPLLPILLGLQIFIVSMSKTLWFISEMIFSNRCMRMLLMRGAAHEFSRLHNLRNCDREGAPATTDEYFEKYSEALMHMPGEHPAGVWIANKKQIVAMIYQFKEGKSRGIGYTDLISLLRTKTALPNLIADSETFSEVNGNANSEIVSEVNANANSEIVSEVNANANSEINPVGRQFSKIFPNLHSRSTRTSWHDLKFMDPFAISVKKLKVEGDLIVGKNTAKMTAASLLTILMELSTFYEADGVSLVLGNSTGTVNGCIKACSEAWEIMELVESQEPQAALVNKQADSLFKRLKESRSWLGIAIPMNNSNDRSVEDVKTALRALREKAEQMANSGHTSKTGYDSKDWKKVIAGNSLYKLCESIITIHSNNIEEIFNVILTSLADVIWSSISGVENLIMANCRQWAGDVEEEMLWYAFELAGRVKGVTDRVKGVTEEL